MLTLTLYIALSLFFGILATFDSIFYKREGYCHAIGVGIGIALTWPLLLAGYAVSMLGYVIERFIKGR